MAKPSRAFCCRFAARESKAVFRHQIFTSRSRRDRILLGPSSGHPQEESTHILEYISERSLTDNDTQQQQQVNGMMDGIRMNIAEQMMSMVVQDDSVSADMVGMDAHHHHQDHGGDGGGGNDSDAFCTGNMGMVM